MPCVVQVNLLGCKFLDSTGTGWLSDAAECVDFCKAQGAQIISGSFGGWDAPTQTLRDAIRDSGALFVAAAGNSGRDLDASPSTYIFQPAGYDLVRSHCRRAGMVLLRIAFYLET